MTAPILKAEYLRRLELEWRERAKHLGVHKSLRCSMFSSSTLSDGSVSLLIVEWIQVELGDGRASAHIEKVHKAKYVGDFDSVDVEVGDEVKVERGSEFERDLYLSLAALMTDEPVSAEALH